MKKRIWLLIVAACCTFLAVGGIAQAKGPESATVAGPNIDEPIELIGNGNSDRVVQFMAETELWTANGDSPRPAIEPDGRLGPAYTLTWINSGPASDTVEERTIVQFLYLQAEDGPMIHTPSQLGLDGWGHGVVGWFTASDRLPETLYALGVPRLDEGESGVSKFASAAGYLAIIALVVLIGVNWADRNRRQVSGARRQIRI